MTWRTHFVESTAELRVFLGDMTDQQAQFTKVLEGRKPGYAVYGWLIVYPEPTTKNA